MFMAEVAVCCHCVLFSYSLCSGSIWRVVYCRLSWQQSDVVVHWEVEYNMFNGLIIVGAVDTLCSVFFLDAM